MTDRLDYADRHTMVLGSNLIADYGLEPPTNAILYNFEQVTRIHPG